MTRPVLSRVFCLGPISDDLRVALENEYDPVEITELAWDVSSETLADVQAAWLCRAFHEAGGSKMTLGERILCLPRSLSALAFFLEWVNRGDEGIPRILVSDAPDAATNLRVMDSDAAIPALRRL